MRVDVLDPAAFTLPYDVALVDALRAGGTDARLITRPFRHGDAPRAAVHLERFGASRAHPRNMLRHRGETDADLCHFQWLALPELDRFVMPNRPWVVTAHDILPRTPRRFQRSAHIGLLRRADAVIVHSEHGAARLRDEAGVDPERITVIAHGVLDHLAAVEPVLPPELPPDGPPVVLAFGLIRPYKGLDLLLDAWRQVDVPGELWIVGNPRGVVLPEPLPPGVRAVTRFVTDAEAAAVLRRAALVVLPYREIDQSGVLFAALGLGKALVLSDVGGFSEVDAAVHVPAGSVGALGATVRRLLADPPARAALERSAAHAARTSYAWAPLAEAHRALYARVLGATG